MSGIAALVALVDRLQAENRDLAAAAAVWQERARVLGEQLVLTAPQQPQDASGSTEGQKPSLEPSSLWWHSWAGYGVGVVAVVALMIGLLALLR